MPRKPLAEKTLNEIREEIAKHKQKGDKMIAEMRKLQGHFIKMQEYYSTWEDELDVIQAHIDDLAEKHQISLDAVEEFDALSDLLGDIDDE